jgi:glycosyltransferase involved in cell wall biosynthesis
VRIAMLQGTADPERDGVAGYTAALGAALGAMGVEVTAVPVVGTPASVVRAAQAVRRARPDLVHLQFAPSAFGFRPWPGLLPDVAGAPLVVTLHEYGWWSAPRWVPARAWRVLERRGLLDRETWRAVPAAAAVVTTNGGHAAALADRFGTGAPPAVTVPLAPNVADAGDPGPRAAVRRRHGVPVDADVVAFFGFVHPVKGVRYLIDALAALRAQGRDVHLLVAGGFTSLALPEAEARAFRAELDGHTRERGVAPHVTVTGHLPAAEVSALLHAADVAAFPFTAGATTKSGALLSAFAHGLPTIVTEAEPADPQLRDGDTVVVADRVRDGDALAKALARVLDDPGLRARVAAGGAALAAARTWPRVAAAHQELYQRVLGRA